MGQEGLGVVPGLGGGSWDSAWQPRAPLLAAMNWCPGPGEPGSVPELFLMGKGDFCAVRNIPGGCVGLYWAGCWAAKLDDLGFANFSGNFKDFLELEIIWILH